MPGENANPTHRAASSGRRGFLAAAAAAMLPWAPPARAATVNMVTVGRDGWLFPVWDQVRHSDAATVRRVTETLNEAIAILAAAKIEVAVSLTPAKSRVYRDYLPDDVRWAAEAEQRYGLALAQLRQPGTLVPDQAALFAQLRTQRSNEPLFFKADTHWTAFGAGQSATLLAQEARNKLHLPQGGKPGIQLAAPETITQEHNDLASLLPAAEQSKYPFQSYAVRKPAAAGGSALLANDAADVLVMGNSYMQPAYGYASVVSEQLDRPVSLFWKVHQMSPYWTMLQYLASDVFAKQRPRLIVWNLAEGDMESAANNSGTWGSTAMPPAAFLDALHKTLGV